MRSFLVILGAISAIPLPSPTGTESAQSLIHNQHEQVPLSAPSERRENSQVTETGRFEGGHGLEVSTPLSSSSSSPQQRIPQKQVFLQKRVITERVPQAIEKLTEAQFQLEKQFYIYLHKIDNPDDVPASVESAWRDHRAAIEAREAAAAAGVPEAEKPPKHYFKMTRDQWHQAIAEARARRKAQLTALGLKEAGEKAAAVPEERERKTSLIDSILNAFYGMSKGPGSQNPSNAWLRDT